MTAEELQSLIQKAESGNKVAQYNLGLYYDTKQEYDKAAYWYKKSAEQGVAKAQCNLGGCYGRGQGVEQNHQQEVYWYTKAAEQGNAIAQYNLAIAYWNGAGVTKDDEKAAYWYKKAAEQIATPYP